MQIMQKLFFVNPFLLKDQLCFYKSDRFYADRELIHFSTIRKQPGMQLWSEKVREQFTDEGYLLDHHHRVRPEADTVTIDF